MNGAPMNEAEFVQYLMGQINQHLLNNQNNQFRVFTNEPLKYAYEIFGYDVNNQPNDVRDVQEQTFEIDILIKQVEINHNGELMRWIPRVAIECKWDSLTTHDAITYSAKALMHKRLHPYLRYGIVIGGFNNIPPRLLRLGLNFDFMVALPRIENHFDFVHMQNFLNTLRDEIQTSQNIQTILQNGQNNFLMIHRRFLILP